MKTIEEMCKRLDEIERANGVANAWRTAIMRGPDGRWYECTVSSAREVDTNKSYETVAEAVAEQLSLAEVGLRKRVDELEGYARRLRGALPTDR